MDALGLGGAELGLNIGKVEMKFRDAAFIIGLPLTTSSFSFAKLIASIWTPFIVRAPFSSLYLIDKKQALGGPKFESW